MVWKCIEGCRDCCGIVPVPREVFFENRKLVQTKITMTVMIGNEVVAATPDGRCVFLDRNARRCLIYNQRPKICRDYGQIKEMPCPYLNLKGERRSKEEIEETKKIISKKVDSTIEKLGIHRKQMQKIM